MKVQPYMRHGDLSLLRIDVLPEGITASTSKVLMTGSHGNDHAFVGDGTFYPKEERVDNTTIILGYFSAHSSVKLVHPDHGENPAIYGLKYAPVDNGMYQLRRQVAQTHSGMEPVQD